MKLIPGYLEPPESFSDVLSKTYLRDVSRNMSKMGKVSEI